MAAPPPIATWVRPQYIITKKALCETPHCPASIREANRTPVLMYRLRPGGCVQVDERGRTPLHVVLSLEEARRLVNAGANVNAKVMAFRRC
jgi:hypothetical protein